jgi:hypothetical protein
MIDVAWEFFKEFVGKFLLTFVIGLLLFALLDLILVLGGWHLDPTVLHHLFRLWLGYITAITLLQSAWRTYQHYQSSAWRVYHHKD